MKQSLLARRSAAFILPVVACACTVVSAVLAWSFCAPARIHSHIAMLDRASSQVLSQALIKGYSRPEEAGAVSCPDTDADGLANTCASSQTGSAAGLVAGFVPRLVNVSPGQLLMAPGTSASDRPRPTLLLNTGMNSGEDLSAPPAAGSQTAEALAWKIAFRVSDAGIGEAQTVEKSRSRSESQQAVEDRLKAAFIAHLQLSTNGQRQRLTPEWAFGETLHLSYQSDSAGTRFAPLNSGCQCVCTKTRCKCACFETSTWESTGSCMAAADAGTCTQAASPGGAALTRCTASAGKYCYLSGAAWLSKRWAASLYTPRASEGRSCRPERIDECPLTSKSGTTCTCAFDWPKALSAERMARMRLQFENGKAKAVMTP